MIEKAPAGSRPRGRGARPLLSRRRRPGPALARAMRGNAPAAPPSLARFLLVVVVVVTGAGGGGRAAAFAFPDARRSVPAGAGAASSAPFPSVPLVVVAPAPASRPAVSSAPSFPPSIRALDAAASGDGVALTDRLPPPPPAPAPLNKGANIRPSSLFS